MDWDFAELKQSERQHGVHFFHPYPAKFIPQIPLNAIKILSKPGDIVLDPFMGSGTTLIEARSQGLACVGIDSNPLAIKIAKAKTLIVHENEIKEINSFINWIYKKNKNENIEISSVEQKDLLFKDSHLWFRSDVAIRIMEIQNEIQKYSPDIQNFIQIGLSSLLKGMSNARMDSIIPTLPKEPTYIDRKHYYRKVDNNYRVIPVFTRVYSQIRKMLDAIVRINESNEKNGITKIIEGDARFLTKYIQKCNLIITSPPYWSAQNYEENHKLSFKLFGLKQIEGKEIGRDISSYINDMENVFKKISKILKGYFVFVIGQDNQNSVDEILVNSLKKIGFVHIKAVIRNISNQTSRAKMIKKEYIHLFHL